MDRAKELYAEMVQGCLFEHKDPDIAILQRIAPDLELDKENILQVFQDDLALARDTIKAAKGFAKNHSKIEAIYSGHEATNEKSYFASCSEERTSIADRLKELNREKADYTRACHLKRRPLRSFEAWSHKPTITLPRWKRRDIRNCW